MVSINEEHFPFQMDIVLKWLSSVVWWREHAIKNVAYVSLLGYVAKCVGTGHWSGGRGNPRILTPGTSPINTPLDTLCLHLINIININISGTFLFLEQEKDLVELTLEFSRAGFPLMSCKVRNLAYEFAQINNIKGFSRNS